MGSKHKTTSKMLNFLINQLRILKTATEKPEERPIFDMIIDFIRFMNADPILLKDTFGLDNT